MDGADILQGATMEMGEEEIPQTTGRGFANPDILQAAQATRAANRAAREPQDLMPDGSPATKKPRQKRSERSLAGIEKLLSSIHMMAALATGFEDLKIDPEESHLLAEALATLGDYYKIKLDGKSGAIMGLIYAAGAVYGPRAVTIGIKLRAKQTPPPKAQNDGDTIS
jgi:hypothetical protein